MTTIAAERPWQVKAAVTVSMGDARAKRCRWRATTWLIVGFAVLAAACSDPESPTSPTETTATTQTVAEPSITEEFTGVLPTGGSAFYSFTVGAYSTVNVTLSSINGVGVPSTVWMALGIGVPSGEDCATTTTVNGPSSAAPQLSSTRNPGVYCVRIHDIGNLFGPARFIIAIGHP